MMIADSLSTSAVITLLLAIVILFGGLTVCITIAVMTARRKREEGFEFAADDDCGEE